MARDYNKWVGVGRLGRDPETRVTQGGTTVTNFSIACSYNSGGEEKTEWVKITAWDKLAEICRDYLRKGKQVLVEGRLETRKWTDKDGIERYTTEVVANDMQMLGSKGDGGERHDGGDERPDATATPAKSAARGEEPLEDDIPF